jgi:hypothetical protein
MEKVESHHITPVTDDTAKSQAWLEKNESKQERLLHVQTLGSIRLRDEHTGAVILVPTPTQDPNDPLVGPAPHPSLPQYQIKSSQKCRTGITGSKFSSPSLSVWLFSCAISSPPDQLSPSSRSPRHFFLPRFIPMSPAVSPKRPTFSRRLL